MNVRRVMNVASMRYGCAAMMLLAATACDDGSTEPRGDFSGVYDLQLVGGQTLPALYFTFGNGTRRYMVNASLEFTSASRLADERFILETSLNDPPDEYEITSEFPYRIVGGKLIIDRTNPAAPAAAYSDTAVVEDGILFMTVKTVDGTPNQIRQLTYTRRP